MRRKNSSNKLFDTINNESLSKAATTQIEDLILSGVLREGDMLPGERELAEQMGISRPKVREALQELSQNNLLNIIANDGAYIARLGGEVMSPALIELYNRSTSAIRDNLEYRREKEGFAARLAAQRSTERDRAELWSILEAMKLADSEDDKDQASELDLRLHHSIAFAGHNRTLTHMMTALYALNKSTLFYNRTEILTTDNAAQVLFEQHVNIVEAICQSKPAAAESAAHEHIDYISDLLETSFARRSREATANKRYPNDIVK
jgi:GntR family transcriptional repressor for pyruvate dehydrogenase complex